MVPSPTPRASSQSVIAAFASATDSPSSEISSFDELIVRPSPVRAPGGVSAGASTV